ncbi:hypothetical protein BJ165DRAFT_1515941 [Panaeolus papilionaceus]|nr:hypothetical protein BJ165DRAFT_1515941 [Panaeolus papilionaceus]
MLLPIMSPCSSMNPVFPLEILTYIIEILGNDQICTENPQLRSLGSCALTCKLFASLCRPYTFRCIYLGRSLGSQEFPQAEVSEARLFRLLVVFEKCPHLADYVREFTIIKTDFGPRDLTSTEIRRCKSVFLSFLNLQSLSIRSNMRERPPPKSWNSLAECLTTHYIRRGTIQSLAVHRSGKRPSVPEILTSPRLQHLEIQGSYMDSFTLRARRQVFPTSNITSLCVPPGTHFPLPTLLALPNLEILHWATFYVAGYNNQDLRAPSFKLRELRVVSQNNVPSLRPLVDFYLSHATRCGKLPFARLELLDITAFSNRDTVPVQLLLSQEFNLKTFRFKNYAAPLFSVLDIIPSFFQKFTACTTVCLDLVTPPQDEAYESTIVSISDLFSSLAGNNMLESLTLKVQFPTRSFTLPHVWSRLRSILTDLSAFPALKQLTLDDCVINLVDERQKACQ